MLQQLTIPQVIGVGRASIYMAQNHAAANVLWGQRIVQQPDPTEIALFTDILSWQYTQFPNDSSLRGTANYLIWLCGEFQIRARGLTGGGTVNPIPSNMLPQKIEFTVSGSSPIPNGSSSIVLPLTWAGLGVIFARGGQPQTSVTTEPTYYLWNPVTRVFSVSPAAITSELFSINPV